MAVTKLAASAFLILAVSHLTCFAEAGTWIGGANGAKDYSNSIISAVGASGLGQYFKSTSKDGIDQFNSGGYKIGVSDIPMDVAENKLLGINKLTIPTFIVTYSFVGGLGAAGPKLNPKQLIKIFKGLFTDWSQVGGSAGGISPVARGDTSGQTYIVTKWFHKTSPLLWPASDVGFGPFTNVWGSSVTQVSGSDAVCSTLQGLGNAGIGYIQTGAGVYKCGLNEFLILNHDLKFVGFSKGATVKPAIPAKFPKPNGFWYPLVDALINAKGPKTYPIVSLEYYFYRKSYAGDYTGKYVKSFAKYSLGIAGQALVNKVFLTKLTPAAPGLLKQNLAAVNAIRI